MNSTSSANRAETTLTKIYNMSIEKGRITKDKKVRYIKAQDLIDAFTAVGAQTKPCPARPEITHIAIESMSISIKAANKDDKIDLINYPGAIQMSKKVLQARNYNTQYNTPLTPRPEINGTTKQQPSTSASTMSLVLSLQQ